MTGTLLEDASSFFRDLEADNSKAFWKANRSRFDDEVARPFAALLDDLEPWGPFKTFRMNRDVRFSQDKSPYKTMHGAVARDTGTHYLHVDRIGLLVVAGLYIFTADQLARYREAVESEAPGRELVGVVRDLRACGVTVDGGGVEPLKMAPRGVDTDHPRIELLRLKGLVAQDRVHVTGAGDANLSEQVKAFWGQTAVLTGWLRDQVCPPRS